VNEALVIIPAYNEEAALPGLISEVRAEAPDHDILVVNDGSDDKTEEAALKSGAKVMSLPFNCGIGAAVQTGFKYAERMGYKAAVQVDGDGQHDPCSIARLTRSVLNGEADVVIGSRFLEKGGYKSTFARMFGIRIFRAINSLILGKTITDNTSGFRAYNRKAIGFLSMYYPDDYPEPEAVILLGIHGFSIKEVPVAMRPRMGGVSSITGSQPLYYMTKVLLATFMNILRAFLERRG